MNAVDILKYGQQTVLQTLQSFPEASRETPSACGVWSVKDIIAHLASYELVLIDVLSTFARSESDVSTPYLSRYTLPGGQFNDEEVTVRKQKSMKEVLGECNDAHARVLSMILRISPETLRQTGTLPWYGTGYCLDDVLAYMYYGHKREHSAQIAAFRDQLS